MTVPSTTTATDGLARAWQLAPQVSVRPEPFGALVYDFDTRRLSFLKSTLLRDVVQSLDAHASALDACRAAGVADAELPRYAAALDRLAETHLIVERTAQVTG
ncbi:mycofactocin biosynthesis chaperone MftB [Conexibacter sp. CPCC 206217]|uniref:mycofactocin biosynthesis chaperone MftB n=1 Tax=Conexibacter sp. CPCC 206217 TaxID=3064574 RepID=UPI00271C728A|nr:mycofactocin biosynthesis chaperone MftB [Conexibacter sp. CPCC 206217]MDO8210274.1 mycofactocin biosynthesis chaperone MftB [Conexibacter sp. CPCC 206217]